MRLPFGAKLLASHVALVAAVVVLLVLELNRVLGADLARQLDDRLLQQANAAALWVGEGRRHPDKLAGRLALVVHADVTIFDRDGRVLGESNAPRPPSVGDAASLPEVAAARTGAVGRATRAAPDGSSAWRFVAVPAGDGEVLRLAAPLDAIGETLAAMQERLLVSSILALVAAVGLGVLASRVVARPLRVMTRQASRLADGQYDAAVPSDSPDELGILSRALSSLSGQLKAKIGDLTTERDRLSAILSGMAEGVLVIDADGCVDLVNPAASRILELAADATGKPLGSILSDADLLAEIGRARSSETITESEVRTATSGGRAGRAIALYVCPLATAPEGGRVVVLRDLTRMRQLMTVRRDFVANVSHELRTPVTAIQGYAETLLRSKVDEATSRQFLEIVHRHASRIGALVEGLLRLSELEARPAEHAVREPIDLAAVAASVCDTMRDRATAAGCPVMVEVDANLRALGDAAGLEQVLENLVDNALKYGAGGGTIRVRAAKQGDRVTLTVLDRGPGIDARHLPRLFERFYRVDAGHSTERGGSGLGLAIVKHLVEAMGGSVVVESEPLKETRFTVDLPAA